MAILDQLLNLDWKAVGAFITSAPLVNIPLLLIVLFIGWWFRGREDSGTIRALKERLKEFEERLKGRDDQFNGQIRGLEEQLRARNDQLSARDERLKLADDRYKDLMNKLTVATDEIVHLKDLVENPDVEPGKITFFKSLQFSVDRTAQAIESANTSSAALGRTLTIGPTVGRPVTPDPPKPIITAPSDRPEPKE